MQCLLGKGSLVFFLRLLKESERSILHSVRRTSSTTDSGDVLLLRLLLEGQLGWSYCPPSNLKINETSEKLMPSYSRLDTCWSVKNFARLLALFLALTLPAPPLLAGDDDHNNDREHGRFVDPIVGSWIIHIRVTAFTFTDPTLTPPPLPIVLDNMTAFWEDGNTTSSDPVQGTAYGVWRKLGPMTYATKIVQVNQDGTLTTIESISSELIGNEAKASFHGKQTDSTGRTVLAQFSGTVVDERITFQSTP
jgi:hypothetical protein